MKKFSNLLLVLISTVIIDACQNPDVIEKSGSPRLNTQDQRDRISSSDSQNPSTRKVNTDLTVSGDYEVRNGMLVFKSVNTFYEFDKRLRDLDLNDRVEFTKQLGLTSLLDVRLQVFSLIDQSESKDQYDQILAAYNDIIQLKDGRIVSRFDDFSTSVINREGMVSIGGFIHCFAKENTIIGDDIEKVRATYKTGKAFDASVIISLTEAKRTGARRLASCGTFDQTAYSPDGKREVRCTVTFGRRDIYSSGSAGFYVYDLEYYVYVQGVPRKTNFFGSWVGYSTSNDLYSRFTATQFFNIPPSTPWTRPTYFTATVDDTRSIEGGFIDYSRTLGTQYSVGESYRTDPLFAVNGGLTEASNLGLYSSGGVPSGALMKCN